MSAGKRRWWGRRFVVPALAGIALVGLGVTAAVAQEPAQAGDLEDYALPGWVKARIDRAGGFRGAERWWGHQEIESGQIVRGSVVVLEGVLEVRGGVEGDVLVVNGDVEVARGGWVDGNVTVVGGTVTTHGTQRIGGEVAASPGRVQQRYVRRNVRERQDRRVETTQTRRRRPARRWDRDRSRVWADADIQVRLGPTYNRTEGLPVGVGPRLRTSGPASLELEALAILRTATSFGGEEDDFDRDELGYRVRAEQLVGYDAGAVLGGEVYDVVQAIDPWRLSDEEASLATLFLHDDYRDYFDRQGWALWAGTHVRDAGLRFLVEYREETYDFRPVADPWTVSDDDVWRPQPLVAEGELTSLGASLRMDLPDSWGPYDGGWSLEARARWGLDGTLVGPALGPADTSAASTRAFAGEDIRTGFVELRRYHHLGWNNRLDFRVMAGGSLADRPLPPQFQHAIGGVGSLPGHLLLSGDCGARDTQVSLERPARGRAVQPTFAQYGCDRFVLAQVEYRGGLDFGVGWDRNRGPDNWGAWEDWDDAGHDSDLRWSVFFDAGRGWALEGDDPTDVRLDTGSLLDAGFGIWLWDVGLLGAVPLDTDRHPWRWFLRFERRF